MKKSATILPIILAILLALCCCLIIVLCGVYFTFRSLENVLPTLAANFPVAAIVPTPTPFTITRQPEDQIPTETLKLLEQTDIPENNLTELACRFKGVCNIAPTLSPPAEPLTIGSRQSFWILDPSTNSTFRVQANLRYITPHSYFWVADNVHTIQSDIKTLMDTFENRIYPTDRAFFGSEWTPGIDGDPHIYILYTDGLKGNVAGYYSSPDEYPAQVFQYSNAHEMLYISSTESLSNGYTYGALAHEFQHVIHWYQDRNETSFLNEGFSELATFLNHYATGFFDQIYVSNPDINLTDWLGSSGDNTSHYGASFLFVTYFLDRFGEETTKALIHNQQNGLASIDGTLVQDKRIDPAIGNIITADDFFLDWIISNFVHDGSVGDGRYIYHNYPDSPKANPTETISRCPANQSTRTVNQYGVDYIRITCPGYFTLRFEGATSTSLLPADPHSGMHAFWSNKGDESDMTLTRTFDLTGVSGPAMMSYWTWYDLEKDFDYVYVEASTDEEHWTFFTTPSGTDYNPSGASYGWGYTGQSNGWTHETIDLSKFVGQKVSIRFEYLTDPAVNGEGFLVDDISVPAINYSTNLESDDGGWQANGFARIENTVPQTFRLGLILRSTRGTTVQNLSLAADQSVDIPLSIGENGIMDAILVITGTTRFTHLLAPYQFSIH